MRRSCPAIRPLTKSGLRPACARPSFSPGPTRPRCAASSSSSAPSPFDLVVDVQGLLKSAVWVALAQSPRKVGYDRTRELSYLPLTERVTPFDPEAHAVKRYLNLAHYLGAPPTPPRFRLGLDAAADISALIPAKTGAPLAVLHPGARWASKLWPPASWANLAEWFHAQGFQVAVTGSPADRELAAAITGPMPGAAHQSGRPHLPGRSWPPSYEKPGWPSPPTPGSCTWPQPGNAGGGALRPHRALAHRAFRRRPPGGPPGSALQPLLQAPLPRPPVPHGPDPGNG